MGNPHGNNSAQLSYLSCSVRHPSGCRVEQKAENRAAGMGEQGRMT